MFEIIGIWGVGFLGYMFFKSKTSYKDQHRCNVKNEIIKLKKYNNHINESTKSNSNSFK